MTAYNIQLAQTLHLPLLADIEHAAAQYFPDHLIPPALKNGVVPLDELEAAQKQDRLWVAVLVNKSPKQGLAEHLPVGFAIAEQIENAAYLREIDVHPDHQGRGLGRQLIAAVVNWALEQDLNAVTLTTFAEVPWNAPYYQRLGFDIVKNDALSRALHTRLKHEQDLGLRDRVAMIKKLI